ncbi:hypothetical protein [Enterobacter ludwigii]|uniref:hypothetical protein n=1 Tax=Enterobacter ludwigii TaxID=299767 RepID=UPI003D177D93
MRIKNLVEMIKHNGLLTSMAQLEKLYRIAIENEEKLAESEARCAALAAENAGLNNFIAASCFVYAGELGYWPAIDHSPETPATNQLSIAESQFLTDVMTAAGLLSCGKRDKQLAQRIADYCVSKRGGSNPAQLRKGVQS